MRSGAHAAAAAVLGLVLTACPEQPQPDQDAGVIEDAGVTISPVELCDRVAAAHCGLIQRCFIAFASDSETECRTLYQADCLERYTQLKPSFEEDKVEIDVEKVASCEQRMQTSACPPSFPPGYFAGLAQAPFSDCTLETGLLRGKVPSGDECDVAVECQPGTACLKPGGVCTGTCSSLSQEGEACGFACAPGLFCDTKGNMDPIDDRCAPPKGVNELCESSAECHPDLWCDGVCKQRGSVGDKCLFDPDRLSTCAPGLACDVVPYVEQVGTCVVPLPQGQRCRYHWSCAPGLVCFDLDFATFPDSPPQLQGICGPPAPVDETCPFTPYAIYLGDQCGSGTRCSANGLCELRPALGEACNPFSQACSGKDVYCKPSETAADQGTCTGAVGLNERCASRLDNGLIIQIPCQSGYCDTETTLKCLPPNRDVGQECASDGECLSGRCAVQEDRTLRCANACL